MPQLTPFFFFNQIVISFVVFMVIVYILSKYILPNFTFLHLIRVYITKLSNKN